MKKVFFLLATLLFLAPALRAENSDRLEVTVHSGWSFYNTERRDPGCVFCKVEPFFGVTTTVDSSPMIGVKVGYYLNGNAEVEGSFAVSPSHNVITDNSFICPPGEICPLMDLYFPFFHAERNMVVYQYGGSFVYNLMQKDLRPFVSFGIGGVSSDVDLKTSHDFAFQFGGGAKVYFNRIGLRFEAMDQVIPNNFLTDKTQHNVQVQYGFIFRLW